MKVTVIIWHENMSIYCKLLYLSLSELNLDDYILLLLKRAQLVWLIALSKLYLV